MNWPDTHPPTYPLAFRLPLDPLQPTTLSNRASHMRRPDANRGIVQQEFTALIRAAQAVNDPWMFGLQDGPGSAIVTGLAVLAAAARNA